eukprot:COSAG01_NODE_8242_length_2858_cov_29.822037_1_plen_78_part_00
MSPPRNHLPQRGPTGVGRFRSQYYGITQQRLSVRAVHSPEGPHNGTATSLAEEPGASSSSRIVLYHRITESPRDLTV